MQDERHDEQRQREKLTVAQFSLFGHEKRTRIILLVLALLNVAILALVAGYLFNVSWDPYSPARHLW
ncbi:hypothetical protein [Microvirga sp. VF16]|uniref:hypothetical protein n=1 Tax=Microvirga sp. VF16 TaxID=2807101 RepID=UPI00193DB6A8|nr:hypothetical protein [Microvirga sp. VF16]QRM27362.1 hypothetical protein JO965_13735 [Microvirga sp. VF16]